MMAAAAPDLSRNRDVLRDLLHSVSQPITTLHCALERSLELDEPSHLDDMCLALEQTDRVIETVRLMREYVEAEQDSCSKELAPISTAIEKVLQQLSVLAEARGVRLLACGASKALVPVAETWLERALSYLVGTLIESAQSGATITVLLEDGPLQSVLSGHSIAGHSPLDVAPQPIPVSNSLRQARVAIARRALESSGASVESYSDEKPGFVIRLPRTTAARQTRSA
ncbi:MAG: hypothetical protein WAL71_04575 [Terriglobales bacterium]|jgi:hypothetical protein